MSLREILGPLINKLDQQEYGTKIETKDGRYVDTGVQKFMDALRDAANDPTPLSINQPITINNFGVGPAFLINNQGPSVQGMEIFDADGHYASVGVGLGSEGIIANQTIPLPQYTVDTKVADSKYSNMGGKCGVAVASPPDPTTTISVVNPGMLGSRPYQVRTPGGHSGSGYTGNAICDVESGYGLEQSGSGFPYDILGGNDTFTVDDPAGTPGSGSELTAYADPTGDQSYTWADTSGTNAARIDDGIRYPATSGDGNKCIAKSRAVSDDNEEAVFTVNQPLSGSENINMIKLWVLLATEAGGQPVAPSLRLRFNKTWQPASIVSSADDAIDWYSATYYGNWTITEVFPMYIGINCNDLSALGGDLEISAAYVEFRYT